MNRPDNLTRYGRILLVVAVFLASIFLTWKHSDRFFASIPKESASLAVPKGSPSAGYDLASLRVLNSVLLLINQCYVDPARFDPHKMLVAALEGIEDEVPDIIVTFDETESSAEVQVDRQSRKFDIKGVNSPWAMSSRLKKVFEFIKETLQSSDIEPPEIEYAAINGMLSTLDPHTRLLTPDYYEEMKMDTEGEFGGLGIVISSPAGELEINEVLPDTPAMKNGLECGDKIVQIEEESTVNMDVTEAVSLLRGKSGTSVTVWIMREGWKTPKPIDIERAQIHIESINSKLLQAEVGYVKVSGFQENTYEDLRIHLEKLKKQGMKSLVLDFRNNPGGLLEQSKFIADVFLFAGNMVTTSVPCESSPKDSSPAHVTGTEPNYPIALLINRGSASASEIVAGALKNHDRAIVIGERSFGKGSIQQLKELDDGSALKYTIGQYLTPGDVSIQGTGIMPDILLSPMFVDAEKMDIFEGEDDALRESDLEQSLQGQQDDAEQEPVEKLLYVFTDPGKKGGKCPPGMDDIIKNDYEVKLAASILKAATSSSRPKMIQQAKAVLEAERVSQEQRLVKDLKKLKIDWESCGEAAPGDASDLEISFFQDGKKVERFEARSGQTIEMTLTVQNRGKGTFCRLYALASSDNGVLEGRELLLGKLKPGQKKSWVEKIEIPESQSSRVDPVKFEFSEQRGVVPQPRELRFEVKAPLEPSFAVAWQMLDDIDGDGDGWLEPGETARMRVHVSNTGQGESRDSVASIKNLSGQGIYIQKGREELADLAPGKSGWVDLKLKMLESYKADGFKLEVSVTDFDRAVRFKEKVEIDTRPAGAHGIEPVSLAFSVATDGAVVLPGADDSLAFIGTLPAGTRVVASARSASLVRVQMAGDGWGWMLQSDLAAIPDKPADIQAPAMNVQWKLSMPLVILESFEPQTGIDGEWSVRQQDLLIKGYATGTQPIKDVYIYMGSDKVFYASNDETADPNRIAFATKLQLQPGVNYVLVTVRHSETLVARTLLVIRRDNPDGSTMESPKKKLMP